MICNLKVIKKICFVTTFSSNHKIKLAKGYLNLEGVTKIS